MNPSPARCCGIERRSFYPGDGCSSHPPPPAQSRIGACPPNYTCHIVEICSLITHHHDSFKSRSWISCKCPPAARTRCLAHVLNPSLLHSELSRCPSLGRMKTIGKPVSVTDEIIALYQEAALLG
jgi:hypothetical protein